MLNLVCVYLRMYGFILLCLVAHMRTDFALHCIACPNSTIGALILTCTNGYIIPYSMKPSVILPSTETTLKIDLVEESSHMGGTISAFTILPSVHPTSITFLMNIKLDISLFDDSYKLLLYGYDLSNNKVESQLLSYYPKTWIKYMIAIPQSTYIILFDQQRIMLIDRNSTSSEILQGKQQANNQTLLATLF